MSEYERLVSSLVNAPMSGFKARGMEKLQVIAKYSEALFGGKIHVPSIVVAGTKGKGSTCTVAESVLRANRIRTGLYTSPHLTTPRERICINGRAISERLYMDAYDHIQIQLKRNGLPVPPFFAMHTLMAGLLYCDGSIDAAVIECGVGGRFDWTKIFNPTVTGITKLEYEHTESLGNTPREISWHKFGVCTQTSRNFTIPQQKDFGDELALHSKNSGINITTIAPKYAGSMGLIGPCAEENTALGIALARSLCESLKIENFDPSKGAAQAAIAGRFHQMKKQGITWLLDGAHTTESILHCTSWYDSLKRQDTNDCLICATTKKRNPEQILAPLLNKKWKRAIYIDSYSKNKKPFACETAHSIEEALTLAKGANPEAVLVTGSLHLVGDFMKMLGWKP